MIGAKRAVDLSTKPITTKTTRADIKKQKDDALYRTQLKEDMPSLVTPSKQTTVPKKPIQVGNCDVYPRLELLFFYNTPKIQSPR